MALVQTTAQLRTQESGASSNLAFGSNVTAGSALFLYVGNYPSGISSVSDSQGNTWQKADGVGDGGINFGEVWYALNAAAGATTITISPTSTSGNYLTAWAQEWSGVQTSGALDRTGTATNTNTVSTSLATQQADELLLTVAVADTGAANINWGTPTDYTLVGRENDSNNYTGLQAAYRVVAATGTQSATHTVSGIATSAVDAVIATFRLASSGGTGTLSQTLGAATAASAGALTISGSSARTLGAATLSSAAALTISGSSAVTLGAASSSSAGALAISGALAGTLGAVTAVAAGDVVSGLSGSTAATLGALTATSAAALTISGAASITLGAASSSSVATLAISGALSALLGPLTAASEGAIAGSVEGSVSQTLGQLTASSVGDNSNPLPRRGGGSPRRGYIYKGQRYYLTPEELAVLIAQDVIAPAEVKQVSRKQKAKAIDPGTWAEVEAVLKRLEKLTEPEDDDEEEEALLLLI